MAHMTIHSPTHSPPEDEPQDGKCFAKGACKRCSIRKRKCDRRLPCCTGCMRAGVPCEAETRSSDRVLIQQVNQLRGAMQELENSVKPLLDRVAWLEDILRRSTPSLRTIHDIPTGQEVDLLGSNVPPPAAPLSPVSLHELAVHADLVEPASSVQSPSSACCHPTLPSISKAFEIAHAYLRSHCQTHHVIDTDEIGDDIKKVYSEGGLSNPLYSASRFRVFSVLYLHMMMSTEENSGDQAIIQACRSMAIKEVKHVLHGQDLLAVQSLVFLCRFAIREPGGPGLWQLAGMAARTALMLRLHRKDASEGTASASPGNEQWRLIEKRKNIFWAVYNLDRLATFILNQPPSIRDSDIEVELPSQQYDPSSDPSSVSSAAIRNHSLKLRMLYGRIQDTVYGVSAKSDRPMVEREQVVTSFVCEVKEWYQTSPLKAAFVPISDATINRQFLDDVSYHQMILALHRPSTLVPEIPPSFVTILKHAAISSIDLYRHYFTRKEVPTTWIHLYQIFTSSITLVKCFGECRRRTDLQPVPLSTVQTKIEHCRDLLAHFGSKWPESRLYQVLFSNLVDSFTSETDAAEFTYFPITQPSLLQVQHLPASATSDPVLCDFLSGLWDAGDEFAEGALFDLNFPAASPGPYGGDQEIGLGSDDLFPSLG